MNTKSIGFRLLLFYAMLIVGVLALLAFVTCLSAEHYLEKNLGDTLLKRGQLIADTLVSQVRHRGEVFLVQEVENRFAPEIYGRFIRITAGNGRVLYVSGAPKDQSFDPALVGAPPAGGKSELIRREVLADGTRLLRATVYYTATSGEPFTIEVGSSLAATQSFVHQLLIVFLIVFPVVTVVTIGGGHFLIRQALAPVERIATSAEEITFHNLSQRLPVAHTGDELEKLALALNRMIGRLEQSFQHTRRFSADASHELRTPLTILQGELEILAQNQSLPTETRETLGSLLEESERLHKIVDGLLALAKIDSGEANQHWTPVDLAQLAASTADQMSLLAEDKKISITCEASEAVPVDGDSGRLKQVIVNLLDNAIKFTPPGGQVVIRTQASNGTARLEVRDTGVGIPASAIPRVFERFFRVDEARSRDEGGAGLGLSIVKSIITAHGGMVSVQSEPQKETCFRIQLPSSPVTPERDHPKSPPAP